MLQNLGLFFKPWLISVLDLQDMQERRMLSLDQISSLFNKFFRYHRQLMAMKSQIYSKHNFEQ